MLAKLRHGKIRNRVSVVKLHIRKKQKSTAEKTQIGKSAAGVATCCKCPLAHAACPTITMSQETESGGKVVEVTEATVKLGETLATDGVVVNRWADGLLQHAVRVRLVRLAGGGGTALQWFKINTPDPRRRPQRAKTHHASPAAGASAPAGSSGAAVTAGGDGASIKPQQQPRPEGEIKLGRFVTLSKGNVPGGHVPAADPEGDCGLGALVIRPMSSCVCDERCAFSVMFRVDDGPDDTTRGGISVHFEAHDSAQRDAFVATIASRLVVDE